MVKEEHLEKILFLDIETVSAEPDFEALAEDWQNLWAEKTRFQREEGETAADFYPKRAAILAEFGQIVCISCGFFTAKNGPLEFRVKSFASPEEAEVLQDFADLVQRMPQYVLCAHNGKEFDFPYISRRMLINAIPLPVQFNNAGKKPWEVPHLDTLELWKFGDYKNYTSLKLLAAIFDIPTPKDDIDGSMVGDVYWKENDLDRIQVYCEKDVLTLAKVFLKINQIYAPQAFDQF
jgi:uncharacterized protein YprB with RNaseH-like and TPR domain